MSAALDDRAFRAALPAATRAALTERADGPGLRRLGLHLGLILALGGWIAAEGPFWPLLLVPQGVLIVFLFTLLHETVHETPFRTPWLNRWTGRLAGFALALPPDWFRLFHLAHHRHTQDPARDPELAAPPPASPGAWAWRVSGLPLWASHARTLLRNARGRCDDRFVPAPALPRVAREARIMLALYALILAGFAAGADWLLRCWWLPALLGQPFLRLYLMAEHGRCPMVADMFANTRTTFTAGLVRFFAWNMPFHAEHHAFPAVPFHRLPALHALARPHLKETERGYLRFQAKLLAGFAPKG